MKAMLFPVSMEDDSPRLMIDSLQIHEEWRNQVLQVHVWNSKAAQCRRKAKRAKVELKRVEAQTKTTIRAENQYKMTNDEVLAEVLQSPLYLKKELEVIDAEFELDLVESVCTALVDRKKALSSLEILWLREYYAGGNPSNEYDLGDDAKVSEIELKAARRRGVDRFQKEGGELDLDNYIGT